MKRFEFSPFTFHLSPPLFSLFKKSPPFDAGYFPLSRDIHSHILPGIDDGAPDVAASLVLVRGLMALGVTESVATPHVISDLYRNTPDTIGEALVSLQRALEHEQLDFKVTAAAEYMLDGHFFELLKGPGRLLTIQDDLILTEFSFGYKPDNIPEISFNILTNGYRPILAHPERYGYFHEDLKLYDKLNELGFLLQVNLLSLTGYYGLPVKKAAKYIVQNQLHSFIGTDMHHERHLAALTDVKNRRIFSEVFGGRRTFNV